MQRAEVTYDGEGRSKGFGTVRFATAAEAQRALQQMNMTQLHNRYGRWGHTYNINHVET